MALLAFWLRPKTRILAVAQNSHTGCGQKLTFWLGPKTHILAGASTHILARANAVKLSLRVIHSILY
jgi:hypothetical protein